MYVYTHTNEIKLFVNNYKIVYRINIQSMQPSEKLLYNFFAISVFNCFHVTFRKILLKIIVIMMFIVVKLYNENKYFLKIHKNHIHAKQNTKIVTKCK